MFKLGCAQLPGFDYILTYFQVMELYLRTCCHLQSRIGMLIWDTLYGPGD